MRLISSLCVILANPVAAEKISLNEISSYFNDMVTAEAQFSQFSDTGETTTGRLYIRRPHSNSRTIHAPTWMALLVPVLI